MKVRRLGGHGQGELGRNKMEGPHNESMGYTGHPVTSSL